MTRVAALLAAFALVAAAPALAGGGMGGMTDSQGNASRTAEALSLQALAILAEGRGHEQAVQKLDQALASGAKGNIDLRALRAAHTALHHEDAAEARRLLEHAFPGNGRHLVGVTYRPQIGTAEVASGIAAAVLLLVGFAGLAHRRRRERSAVSPSAP